MSKRLIVFDDEEGFEFLFEHHFEDLIKSGEIKYHFCSKQEDVFALLESTVENTILLCDLIIPGEDGLEFAKTVNQQYPNLKVLIMSGLEAEEKELTYFSKPLDFVALRQEILKS